MPAADETALLAAIDQIYAAVEQPELWPRAVHAMGELVGGRRGFWGLDPDIPIDCESMVNQGFLAAGSHSFFLSRKDLQILDQYTDQFSYLIMNLLQIVFMSTLCYPQYSHTNEAMGLRIAQRYLQVFEPSADVALLQPSKPALRRLIATLWEEGCVFGEDNLRYMRLLLPHLGRALRLQMRLATVGFRAEMTSSALDSLALGVVLVDASGRPSWLNRRARELAVASNRLQFLQTGAPEAGRHRALQQLMAEAISAGKRAVFAVARGDALRPLLLTAVPLSHAAGDAPDQVCGVVFISDPEPAGQPSVETVRQAFGLTYREAQMALAVAQGHGLRTAADAIGVAVTTARSQLQQVFAKTGTNHQAELAGLVHRALGALRHDEPRRGR